MTWFFWSFYVYDQVACDKGKFYLFVFTFTFAATGHSFNTKLKEVVMVDFVVFQNWARKLSILLLNYDVTYRIFVDYNTACLRR